MAGGGIMRWRGLESWQVSAAANAALLRDGIRRRLQQGGEIVAKAQKAEFGPQYTDRRTRKRSDSGSQIGEFTGRAKRSIRARTYYVKSRRTFRCGIGPRGVAGWYMSLHERGWRYFPKRQVVEPAVNRTRSAVEREVGKTVNVLR